MSEEAIVKNAADKNQVAKAASKIKIAERLAIDESKDIMATRNSRRWVWKMMEWCNVFGPTFRADPYQSAYAEGARLVGLEILKRVRLLGADAFLLMQKEAMEDSERGL